MDAAHLEKMVKDFVGSLLASKSRHTLCLSIAEPGFAAENVVKAALEGKQTVEVHAEPDDAKFKELIAALGGKVTVATFADLDLKPKVVAALLEHVKKPGDPGGKLVVVAKQWASDNTEIRKACLFYQQNLPRPPKEGRS